MDKDFNLDVSFNANPQLQINTEINFKYSKL